MSELEYFRTLNQSAEQQKYIDYISASRGYKNSDILNSYRAIYVRDFNSMVGMLKNTSIYNMLFTPDNSSFVPGKLLIPGFSPTGHLVTYAAFDAVARMESKESGIYNKAYYFYPDSSTGFIKSNFLMLPYESWAVALELGKLGLADGLFDAGAVSSCGLPCASNLGTGLGLGVKKILRVFNEIIHFKDNDSAGSLMYTELVKAHPQVRSVGVPPTIDKDIDGYIKEVGKEEFLKSISPTGRVNLRTNKLKKL